MHALMILSCAFITFPQCGVFWGKLSATFKTLTYPTSRVKISPSTAAEITRMMVAVTDANTIKLDRYSVAMKTGTADRVGDQLAHNLFVVVLARNGPLIPPSIDCGDCSRHSRRKRGSSRFSKVIPFVKPCAPACLWEGDGIPSCQARGCEYIEVGKCL